MHPLSMRACHCMFHPAGMPLFVGPPPQLHVMGRLSTNMGAYFMPLELPLMYRYLTFLFMTAWGIILSAHIRAWDPTAHICPLLITMLPFMSRVLPKVVTNRSLSMLVLLYLQVRTTTTLSTRGGTKEAHPPLVSRYVVSLVLSRSTESVL